MSLITFSDKYRGNHRSFGVPCTTEDKKKIDIAFLDNYATKQWEAILHYMVGTKSDQIPGQSVIKLLLKGGLMEQYVLCEGTVNYPELTSS